MLAVLSDLRLYAHLVWMEIRAQTQYKGNLAIDIGTYVAVTACECAAVLLLFGPFPTLQGWHIGEVALLFALTSISFGFGEMIGAGIDTFDEIIRRGEFDRVLLRPASTLLQVAGGDFRLRRLGRITLGIATLALAQHLLPGLRWSPQDVLAVAMGALSGTAIFVSIQLLGATLCFWTVETTELTNILTYGAREMLSYPMTIYHQLFQRFFVFVVPVAFASFVPTCYVLGRSLPFGLPSTLAFAAPIPALLFAVAAVALWRFGVRRYQSTGS